MPGGQQRDGQDDHDALEHHKGDLLVGQLAVEPLLQLGRAVHAPDEDEQGGEGEGVQVALEIAVGAQVGEDGVEGVAGAGAAAGLADGDDEVEAEDGEDAEGGDLEGDTGDHQVDAGLLARGAGVGDGGDGAAGGLEEEGEEVGGDEDVGVVGLAKLKLVLTESKEWNGGIAGWTYWSEASDFNRVDGDNAGEVQVDGGGEKGWAYCEADEVPGVAG